MGIKLVAIDMDGTLLNSKSRVSQQNKEAVEKAIAKGVLIVPTTGRCYKNAKNIIGDDLKDLYYYINSNGSIIVDNQKEELIYERIMKRDDIKAVYELVRKHAVYTELYSGLDSYADEQGIGHLYHSFVPDELCDKLLETTKQVKDLQSVVNDNSIPVSKYDIIGLTREDITKLRNEIAEIDGLHPLSIGPEIIELVEGRWCKRDGIKKLIEKLNIKKEEVMVIGDSGNDYEMLEWSPNAVAMGNANDKVKRLANYITGTNDEAGVAQALYEYLEI